MKNFNKYLLAAWAVCLATIGFGQTEDYKVAIDTTLAVTMDRAVFGNIDTDSTYEMLGIGTHSFALQFDSLGVSLEPYSLPDILDPQLELADLFNKGKLDLIIAGKDASDVQLLEILEFTGSDFAEVTHDLTTEGGVLEVLDFDNSGRLDLAEASPTGLKLWQQSGATYNLIDSLLQGEELTTLVATDWNGNGRKDFLVGLADELILIENKTRGFVFADTLAHLSQVQSADIDADGQMEIVGLGPSGTDIMILDRADTTSLPFQDEVREVLIGDFVNNGLLDMAITFQDSVVLLVNDSLNWSAETLLTSSVQQLLMGDYDSDHDLDLLVVDQVHEDSTRIRLMANTHIENVAPLPASILFAAYVADSLSIKWRSSGDDRTPRSGITYQPIIYSESQNLTPSVFGSSMLLPDQGCTETGVTHTYFGLPDGMYSGGIYAIDNSFSSTQCIGSGDGCFAIEIGKDPLAFSGCPGDTIELQASNPVESAWYSMTKSRYLGSGSVLKYVVDEEDVVTVNFLNSDGCYQTETFVITPLESPRNWNLDDQILCEGETFELELAMQDTTYWVMEPDTLFGATFVSQEMEESDTLFVFSREAGECWVSDTVFVEVNPLPDVEAGPDVSKYPNATIQLNATGGESYVWSPIVGLDDPTIADPYCIVDETTRYFVESTLGTCSAIDSVLVNVEPEPIPQYTLVVPNLFSPNNDGTNDYFKFYGEMPETAQLTIFDQAGTIVYQSNSPEEIINEGWDGKSGSSELPQATYFWKISGQFVGGQPIRTDQGNSGQISLIR